MTARLFAKTGALKGVDHRFEGEAILGRDKECSLVVPSGSVSKRHARIFHDQKRDHYVLEDLGSLNGTALDGVPVEGEEILGHLHIVTLSGSLEVIFQDLEACRERHGAPARTVPSSSTATPTSPSERAMEGTHLDLESPALPSFLAMPDEDASVSNADATLFDKEILSIPRLSEEDGDLRATAPMEPVREAAERTQLDLEAPSFALPTTAEADEQPAANSSPEQAADVRYALEVPLLKGRLSLKPGENIVGRSPNVPVRIDVLDVSRRHAVLCIDRGKVTVRDLGSSNHTFVDEQKVDQEMLITPESQVHFGSVEVRLVRDEEEA